MAPRRGAPSIPPKRNALLFAGQGAGIGFCHAIPDPISPPRHPLLHPFLPHMGVHRGGGEGGTAQQDLADPGEFADGQSARGRGIPNLLIQVRSQGHSGGRPRPFARGAKLRGPDAPGKQVPYHGNDRRVHNWRR